MQPASIAAPPTVFSSPPRVFIPCTQYPLGTSAGTQPMLLWLKCLEFMWKCSDLLGRGEQWHRYLYSLSPGPQPTVLLGDPSALAVRHRFHFPSASGGGQIWSCSGCKSPSLWDTWGTRMGRLAVFPFTFFFSCLLHRDFWKTTLWKHQSLGSQVIFFLKKSHFT